MQPENIAYRLLNLFCHADITRVLLLDTRTARTVHDRGALIKCQWLDSDALEVLANDADFAVGQQFIDDFKQFGFLGVSATVNRALVGILFLAPDLIVARHNSGGAAFKGIGVRMPKGVYYLFKVAVKPESRGKRVNAAMISYAIAQLGPDILSTVVTTTDWTNQSFLSSVENYGFRRCGFASEFVIAGRHFYQLPAAIEPSIPPGVDGVDHCDRIYFFSE